MQKTLIPLDLGHPPGSHEGTEAAIDCAVSPAGQPVCTSHRHPEGSEESAIMTSSSAQLGIGAGIQIMIPEGSVVNTSLAPQVGTVEAIG